jgi:hypothetical protein
MKPIETRTYKTLAAAAVVAAVALAGCGGSTHSTPPASAKPATMADVCGAHPAALGTIAGAAATFKMAMASNTMDEWASSQTNLADAVSELKDAASQAGVPYTPAVRTYLEGLQGFADTVTNPPTLPTKVVGDQDYAKLQADAQAAGCGTKP